MRTWHHLKRWLYLTHRWVGIAACLLFAMWFVSGLVMIYVPYPALTAAERVAGEPAINWSRVRTQAPRGATLIDMRADWPVWHVMPDDGPELIYDAASGARLGNATEPEARRAAMLFTGRHAIQAGQIMRDQWTVAGRYDRDRPLWKFSLDGMGGGEAYVSSKTGAVVLTTDANERFWNWLGSVPHWLYPTVLRQDNAAWRQVVMWVSGPCIAVALTGIWIGILRTRAGQRRFRGGRMTPYHGWMLWHHVAGLVGGVFVVTFIFSGWLSVDPFRLFASSGIDPAAKAFYARAGALPPIDPARLAQASAQARRVTITWVGGRPLLIVERPGDAAVLDAVTLTPAKLSVAEVTAAATMLVPGARIAQVDVLTAPDAYWYGVGELLTLPVLRVRFADAGRTWVHIDPRSGAVLGDMDARARQYRWLFDLLHKWDLNALTGNRPAWDAVLWLLSLAGIVTSLSGVWIGWLRLTGRKRHILSPNGIGGAGLSSGEHRHAAPRPVTIHNHAGSGGTGGRG